MAAESATFQDMTLLAGVAPVTNLYTLSYRWRGTSGGVPAEPTAATRVLHTMGVVAECTERQGPEPGAGIVAELYLKAPRSDAPQHARVSENP